MSNLTKINSHWLDAKYQVRASLHMNKPDPAEVGFVCMPPSLFLEPPKTPSVGSSWKDLSNDLKLKIIDSFARASQTTSCEQVVRLCKDADCDKDEYKKLFLIQVDKLNWPPVQERSDGTLVIPNDQTTWIEAYKFECTRFNLALAAVKKEEWILRLRSMYKQYENNTELIFAAIEHDGLAIQYVTDKLKNDPQKADIYREIVLAAVKKHGFALDFATDNLKADLEIVLAAVEKDGFALQFASPRLRGEPAIVLAAVKNYGWALAYASTELGNDHLKADIYREIVLAAVTQNGSALYFATNELKGDLGIVLAAVRKDGLALVEASPILQENKMVVLAAVTQNGKVLRYVTDKLKNDPQKADIYREIVLAAVTQNGQAFEFASRRLQNDPAVVLAAANHH